MTNETCHKLFVYGSLRQGFESPAYGYISPYFDLVSHARIKGRLYDLGDYPAAKPTEDDAHEIIGELYAIKNADEFEWAMGQLDDYEGVDATEDEPALYYRDLVTVHLPDGQTDTAWVYWYSNAVDGKPLVESGDVLEYRNSKIKAS